MLEDGKIGLNSPFHGQETSYLFDEFTLCHSAGDDAGPCRDPSLDEWRPQIVLIGRCKHVSK